VLYGSQQNDISFTIEGKIVVLIEHQSTINENMPLRMLLYISRVYEQIIDRSTLYRKRRTPIPKPEFIVIYNGAEEYPDKAPLRLSDAYLAGGELALDLVVNVYNIAGGHNRELLARSKALSDYATFVEIIRGYEAQSLSREEAIEKAVYNCARDGIMETYLEVRGSEVMNMLITEFDVEEYYKVGREEGREEGLEKGREEGLEKGAEIARRENAGRMKTEGFDTAMISKVTGLSGEEIEKL
jgi:predicted transposase YdaD